jgi:hypothetical protein
MQDIHIRAYAGENNAPTVAYDVLPSTKRTPAELAAAMDYFQTRLAAKVEHFNRINPNADPKPPKGQLPRLGAAKPLVMAETSTSYCTYDDFGNIDCSGGGGGGGGGGYDVWEYDWAPDETYRDDAASDPAPSFPTGPDADAAQADPCIGPDGSNICIRMETVAQRPQNCIRGPMGGVCVGIAPPPVVDPSEPHLPPSSAPIWPQGACNMINALCSNGQTPEADNERVPANGDTYADYVQQCWDNREVDEAVCTANHKMGSDARTTADCFARAMGRYSSCLTTARGRARKGGMQL